MTTLAFFTVAMLIITAILFVQAFMFFSEQNFLYKEKVMMKDLFYFRLSRITFTITLLLTIINMVL
jgi:hypothetical protein